MKLVEIGRFACTGDNSRRVVVIQRQKLIQHPTYGTAKGTIDYITERGEDVNELDDGRYQIVMTDEILTPNNWTAP